MSELYNVIFKGAVLEGFELERVQNNFAKSFKIELNQAEKYFTGKAFKIRKKITHKQAYQFKEKVESIGMSVSLQRIQPAPSSQMEGLSLVPIEGEAEQSAQADTLPSQPQPQFSCPKCGTVQPKTSECNSCGVIISKFAPPDKSHDVIKPAPESSSSYRSNNSIDRPVDANETIAHVSTGDSFNVNALVAASITALAGAIIWRFIAVAFEYELGIIAWGIGGAIGFAAAMAGSRGQSAGIICGLLALLSILGGKYMSYDVFRQQVEDSFLTESYETRSIYEEEVSAAAYYATNVDPYDRNSVLQFIVDYGYSYSYEISEVSEEEEQYFNDNVVLRFQELNSQNLSFEQWLNRIYDETQETGSTFELLKSNLDWLDFIFLFLGIGTAFRLGSQIEVT